MKLYELKSMRRRSDYSFENVTTDQIWTMSILVVNYRPGMAFLNEIGRWQLFRVTKPIEPSAQIHPVGRASYIKRLDAKVSNRF